MTILDLLRTAGVISSEQFQTAQEYQKTSGGSLAHALVALGYVTGNGIARLVSRLYEVPLIDLDHHEITPAVIAMVPAETARKFRVLPTALNEGFLTIAMNDPRNVLAMDGIAFVTGQKRGASSRPAAQLRTRGPR